MFSLLGRLAHDTRETSTRLGGLHTLPAQQIDTPMTRFIPERPAAFTVLR